MGNGERNRLAAYFSRKTCAAVGGRMEINMKKLVTILLSALLLQGSALAAQLDTVEFNRDTKTVTVSGKTNITNSFVTLELLAPECSWEEVESDRLSFDKLAYFDQTQSDENGDFTFTFSLADKTEKYPLRIFSRVDNEYCYDNTLRTFAESDVKSLLQRAAAAKSAAELAFLTEKDNAEILGLDISVLDEITDISLFLDGTYAEIPTSGIKNISDIQSAFDRGYIVYVLNKASDAEGMSQALEKYSDVLKLGDENSKNLFDDGSIYDAKRKAEALLKLSGMKFKTIDGLKKDFGEQVLLYACFRQESYNRIGDVIAKSKILKSYDIGRYSLLSAKARIDVQKKINSCTKPYTSAAELANAIKDASEPNAAFKPSGGGSGGGSKSSGISGGGIASPELVAATPSPKPEAGKFSDMTGYEWAEDYVNTLKNAGIVSGRNDSEFCPGENVTREEFLKMLVGAMGESGKDTEIIFDDVKSGDWYFDAVNAGVRLGITNGISDTVFGVGENITRQDTAVMVYRALTLTGESLADDLKSDFSDLSEISDYAQKPVRLLAAANIVNGTGDNKFEPKMLLNRASAAKLICEIYNRRKNNA